MNKSEIKSIVEAILFVWGDPLGIKDISQIININEKEMTEIMMEMQNEFNYYNRGLRIIKMDNNYQIGTRPEHYDWIKKLQHQKPAKSLSNATLETLSIIAYKQPVIKSDIDYIRGVRSDRAIKTLIDQNLIKELGRLERTGRPIIYGTTKKFLKLFSLESLRELPDLEKIKNQLEEDK